jgi:hypothetical protein
LATLFDTYGIDRLAEWKRFRNLIQHSVNPLDDCVLYWSKAPFVSPYIDPFEPEKWPDPWKLILDGKYDNLAIALGMLYTLQLTQRFMESVFEIHMSINPFDKEHIFPLVIDHQWVLNADYGAVARADVLEKIGTNKIFPKEPRAINILAFKKDNRENR